MTTLITRVTLAPEPYPGRFPSWSSRPPAPSNSFLPSWINAAASSTGRRAAIARSPEATSGVRGPGGCGVVDAAHAPGADGRLELGIADPVGSGELLATLGGRER